MLGSIHADMHTHRPQSSSFLGLPYRIVNMNPKKELLWGLWVNTNRHTRAPSRLPGPATLGEDGAGGASTLAAWG